MIKLAPSLLSADFTRLGEHVAEIEDAGAHYLHLDVLDGSFAPNISFGIPVISALRPVSSMVFDTHLMIRRPERHIEAFAQAGADIINLHVEACLDPLEAVRKIKSLGKKAALTIKPATPASALFEYMEELDLVLVMTVEPGFSGQEFMPGCLPKIEDIAEFICRNGLSTEVEVDGGIGIDNAARVISAGANVIVAGSQVFGAPSARTAVRRFLKAFNTAEPPISPPEEYSCSG